MRTLDAILLIDKPTGISSFGVIREIKRLGRAHGMDLSHIGHGGTLDPFASGLLIVAVGRATRLTRHLLHGSKRYAATVALGSATASGDPETPVVRTASVPGNLTLEDIRSVFSTWLRPAVYSQKPPMYSALKKDGKRLYELAREGIEVEREARACQLWDLEIVPQTSADSISFRISCSGGTYIRTLGEDLARGLRTEGHLTALRRLQSLHFSVEQAVPLAGEPRSLESLLASGLPPSEWGSCVVPFDAVLQFLPQVELSEDEERDLLHGKQEHLGDWVSRGVEKPADTTEATETRCTLYRAQRLVGIAVYSHSNQRWELERAFQREVV